MPADLELASLILTAFHRFHRDFEQVTAQAQRRFEERDWLGGHEDSNWRLSFYDQQIDAVVPQLGNRMGEELRDKPRWKRIKAAFAERCRGRVDAEIAESFFNSVTREVFKPVREVDPEIQFVTSERPLTDHFPSITRVYEGAGTEEMIHSILADCRFLVGFQDIQRDARRVAARLGPAERLEVIFCLFYRNKGAYLVGKIGSEGEPPLSASGRRPQLGRDARPFALALLNPDPDPDPHAIDGIVVDAVLTDVNEISILFSFTRASFRVASPCPYALVAFLKSILPRKPAAELYTSIGYPKHGKTELYRNFIRHMGRSEDQFVLARGQKGMVMSCFTLPSYDVVYKVIKDTFAYPKRTTRTKVMQSYQRVARHDRVGRMVDAQEFEHLRLPASRFHPDLLQELLAVAPSTVLVEDGAVLVTHAYSERRVAPLDLYVREAEPEAVRRAVLDYGQCIKELCASNIFPGDMFLKNFGVTRHGRVVFYDYDEISLVTECHFRTIPAGEGDDDMEAETYFYVGPNDVFPEEFRRFMGLPEAFVPEFEARHGGLFTVEFWEEHKRRLQAGDWTDVIPYPEERRLAP